MFSIPALNWALTAVLALGAAHHLVKTARTGQGIDRVNNALHALMHLLMAAMLWNLAPATLLAQIALLAAAALWFLVQAVARPEFKLLCAGTRGRLACAYHALAMTAAALMIALMAPHTTPDPATATSTGMTMAHAHHHAAATTTTAPPGTAALTPALTVVMTMLFAAAALVFTALLLRKRATRTTRHTAHKHPTRTDHGLEALGATVMALMSATMTT